MLSTEKTPADKFEGITSEAFEDGAPIVAEKPADKPPEKDEEKPVAKAPEPVEDDADEDDEAEQPESTAPQHKPKKSFQERINEFRKKQSEAEARAERLERELAELRRQPKEPVPKKELTEEKTPGKRDPNARPRLEDYAADEFEKFEDDLLEWKLTQKEKAREEARQKEAAEREAQEFQSAAKKKFDAGAKKYPDFVEKVIGGGRDGKYDLADDTLRLAVESEVGMDILYHLASHPEEARALAGKPSLARAAAFGRLEARFSASAAQDEQLNTRERLPSPMKNQPRGTNGQFAGAISDDEMEGFAQFEAKVARENAKRRG